MTRIRTKTLFGKNADIPSYKMSRWPQTEKERTYLGSKMSFFLNHFYYRSFLHYRVEHKPLLSKHFTLIAPHFVHVQIFSKWCSKIVANILNSYNGTRSPPVTDTSIRNWPEGNIDWENLNVSENDKLSALIKIFDIGHDWLILLYGRRLSKIKFKKWKLFPFPSAYSQKFSQMSMGNRL